MYLAPPELQKRLDALNAEYRFTSVAGGVQKDGQGGWERIDDQPGFIKCEIQDRTTGEFYATGRGEDHSEALANALDVALTAPKPLTPAQKADGTIQRQADEIAELKRQLAARDGNEPADVAPEPRRRGRPRKMETVPPETDPA